MSLKKSFFIVFCILAFSCKPTKNENPFVYLSAKEQEKLADYYHEKSMKYVPGPQTGRLHRAYKDSALMAVPDHIHYMQRASYSYKKAGEHIKAMQMLNKAVEMDIKNNSTKALEYKAWSMLYFYRDYESTIKDVDLIDKINHSIKINSCHGESCLLLKGQAYYQLKDYENAIKTFEYLLNLQKETGIDPKDDFYTNFYLGRSYIRSGNIEKGLTYLEAQLQQPYTVKAELNFYIGQVYLSKNEKEKALEYFLEAKKLFEQNDKFHEAYYERFDEIFVEDIEAEIKDLY